MIKEQIEGKWVGHFEYGSGYPEEFLGQPVPFTMDIFFTDNNFKGTCTDELTKKYFNRPATVEGTFEPNFISFIKKYPCLLTADENNTPFIIPDEPSYEIHYTGLLSRSFFSKTYRFKGEWDMTIPFFDGNTKKQYYSLYGTWAMKKSK